MFGVSNQLLAALALFVGTIFIQKHTGKWRYGLITFLPALFMFVTTFVAGIDNIMNNYLPKHTFQGNLNAVLTLIMLALVIIIFVESIRKSISLLSKSSSQAHLTNSRRMRVGR